jgi:Mannosylglycerate hydrolase MGH1-like glycoside hydrolase domain
MACRATMKRALAMGAVMIFLSGLLPSLRSEVFYPWKDAYIGALDGREWFGLVLAPAKDAGFAFRLRIRKGDQVIEGYDFHYLISEVGPQSPDGQYARIRADLSLPLKLEDETPVLIKPSPKPVTLTLEWSRQDERTVVGRIRAPRNMTVEIVHYSPWDLRGAYRRLEDGRVQGTSESGRGGYIFWTNRQAEPAAAPTEDGLTLGFPTRDDTDIYFVAATGETAQTVGTEASRFYNIEAVDELLLEGEERYASSRVKVEGLYQGAPEAITNNLFWMILYQPDHHRLYTPAGRRWIFPQPGGAPDHWTIFEWDSFLDALEVSVESPRHVLDIVKSVLQTQYPNGNIPNWRGRFSGTPDRSQPPVGSYVVFKLFGKIGDLELLKFSYPYLKKWHSFWKAPGASGRPRRDGNGDGLLEWGSDVALVAGAVPSWEENASGKQRAMWESGQDDLPNWEEASFDETAGTLTMNCVDLNSLYALDAYCLAQIAGVLKIPEDYEAYLREYQEMKDLINGRLWNEREGFYFDRGWDGRFSARKAASNFYPLIARIPDEKRAALMIRRLLNPKEFWGDYVLPSISRDDPLFKDQQYWRGTIWPPTNYLVYQGLKACGFDPVAAEFAKKSQDLFLRSYNNFQLCPENFDSRTGEAGGQRFQSWGPLFALEAIEEYLDFTPWEGFRFGMLSPDIKGRLSRLAIQGRHYEVQVSRSKIRLLEEDREIVRADGGAVFRHFLYSENEVSFDIRTMEKRDVEVQFLKRGKYQLMLDNQLIRVFKDESQEFRVPEGSHTVVIQLLEEQEPN